MNAVCAERKVCGSDKQVWKGELETRGKEQGTAQYDWYARKIMGRKVKGKQRTNRIRNMGRLFRGKGFMGEKKYHRGKMTGCGAKKITIGNPNEANSLKSGTGRTLPILTREEK